MAVDWWFQVTDAEGNWAEYLLARDIGAEKIKRRTTNKGVDTLAWSICGVPGFFYSNDLPFHAGRQVRLIRTPAGTEPAGGQCCFQGPLRKVRWAERGSACRIDIQADGMHACLLEKVFVQEWARFRFQDPMPDPFVLPDPPPREWQSRLVLGMDSDGDRQSVAAIIDEAVVQAGGFVTATGSGKFQAQIDADLEDYYIPWDEAKDLSCWEVIARVLRWVPSAIVAWDYNFMPPLLAISLYDNMGEPSVVPASRMDELAGCARPDLRPDAVAVIWECPTTVVDWNSFNESGQPECVKAFTNEIQTAGDIPQAISDPLASQAYLETHPRILSLTLQKPGGKCTRQRQEVDCREIPDGLLPDGSSTPLSNEVKLWWVTHIPALETVVAADLELYDCEVSLPETLDDDLVCELVGGTIHKWICFEDDSEDPPEWKAARWEIVRLSCSADYKRRALDGSVVSEVVGARLSVDFVLCNLPDGLNCYEKTGLPCKDPVEEPVPEDLAEQIWDQVSVLQHEGVAGWCAEEIDSDDSGNWCRSLLDVTGAHPDWATMAAAVRVHEMDVDRGRTRLQFGPDEFQDWISRLDGGRLREPPCDVTVRTHGKAHAHDTIDNGQGPLSVATVVGVAEPCPMWRVTLDSALGYSVASGLGWIEASQATVAFAGASFTASLSASGTYYLYWDRCQAAAGATVALTTVADAPPQEPRHRIVASVDYDSGTNALGGLTQIWCDEIAQADPVEVWPWKPYCVEATTGTLTKTPNAIRIWPGQIENANMALKGGSTYANTPVISAANDILGVGGPVTTTGPAFALPATAGNYAVVAHAHISPDSTPAYAHDAAIDPCVCAKLVTVEMLLLPLTDARAAGTGDVAWACPRDAGPGGSPPAVSAADGHAYARLGWFVFDPSSPCDLDIQEPFTTHFKLFCCPGGSVEFVANGGDARTLAHLPLF